MFSPTHFRDLFQPSYCERRVWLATNKPELAIPDTDFIELIQEKGTALEKNRVEKIGPVETPEYPEFQFPTGFAQTCKMIELKVPIIYQGIFISKDQQLMSIPDLLIFNKKKKRYIVQEIKLATNLRAHPEIELGLGLTGILAKEVLGYKPILEVVTGDGNLISPYITPDVEFVKQGMKLINELKHLDKMPFEPSGWSKCNPCPFFSYCWDEDWKKHHVCTISGIEQGMSRALWEKGITTWAIMLKKGSAIADVKFQRGSQTQRIGSTRADKFLRQARCLSKIKHEIIASLTLPNGYSPGERPIVIFDVENNMPIFEELGLPVDVYLWGLLLVTAKTTKQELIIAPKGPNGDRKGWRMFLSTMAHIFEKYGDIPIVHFSAHEKTKVCAYITDFGDVHSTGQRVLDNLWDLYRAILNTVTLPVPSYSLKEIEKFVGFKRTQEEYGGTWSIVRYNEYLEAKTNKEADKILKEIKTYNGEDLLATYEVYKWMEEHCC
ncbi:MAG: TM0106 family RecB-like putative nuclease [Dehalococcoidales bacterium]|nr:TM0106 family RecB-like putative nuclease [Dehalococcoidales bacterium]